jgi:hypothetical protein
MATQLFRVKVLEVVENKVELELYIVSPEQNCFYDGKGFALMLLYDLITRQPDDKKQSITLENTMDKNWVKENVSKYILDVSINVLRDCSIFDTLESMNTSDLRKFWKNPENLPKAILVILLAKEEFAHLFKKGDSWETSAYDPLA